MRSLRMMTFVCFNRLIAGIMVIFLLFASGEGKAQETVAANSFQTVKARMSNLAADAIGVNTHLNFVSAVYYSHYEDIIKPRLIELGVKHIRDHFGDEKTGARYTELAHKYGVRLLLINNDDGTDLVDVKKEVIRLNGLDFSRPVVDLIEPANERDVAWKKNWVKIGDYLKEYYRIFKSDAATAAIPLLGPSFADTRNSAVDYSNTYKRVSDNMDMANLHAYSGLYPESAFAGGWGISFLDAIKRYNTISAGKPVIESESGYKMAEGMDGHPAVSQRTAAKYSPRLVLERLRAGVGRIYFYQLINSGEDFGMLNDDGTPRLQYSSIKNFISLMKDEGPAFKTGSLTYALSGDTKNIRQMLFQKRNGRYILLLWQGINGSEKGAADTNYVDVDNPDVQISLTLSKKASSVKIYRPSFNQLPDGNGTSPIATVSNQTKIGLSVPDHLLVIEIILK